MLRVRLINKEIPELEGLDRDFRENNIEAARRRYFAANPGMRGRFTLYWVALAVLVLTLYSAGLALSPESKTLVSFSSFGIGLWLAIKLYSHYLRQIRSHVQIEQPEQNSADTPE